jgi:UrcA family protein
MAKSCGHEKPQDVHMATPKLFSLSLVAASVLAISTPAMAEWKDKLVQYDDLDLSAAKGQERFKTRIKQAVKQVCGSPRAITLKERQDQRRCEVDALARAMPKAERTIAMYKARQQLAARDDGAIIGN